MLFKKDKELQSFLWQLGFTNIEEGEYYVRMKLEPK